MLALFRFIFLVILCWSIAFFQIAPSINAIDAVVKSAMMATVVSLHYGSVYAQTHTP